MKREHAQEFTEALAQTAAGVVRLAEWAPEVGIPEALGLTAEEWAQRRLTGQIRLSIPERQAVVAANPDKSTRELGEALGVDNVTIHNDRKALAPVEDSTGRSGEGSSDGGSGVEDSTPSRDRTVLFTSETAEWETPQELYDALADEFAPALDVCATTANAKCARYFTAEDDGLVQEWTGACWMNPPYGEDISRWVAKAHTSADVGATVVCLVPARVDTAWWWDHCRHAEVRFLRGRLRFGGGETSAPFPSAVVIFGRPARVVWWER